MKNIAKHRKQHQHITPACHFSLRSFVSVVRWPSMQLVTLWLLIATTPRLVSCKEGVGGI
jgi:predicted DNA-binding protein (MmcQ/YjbR family)